MKKWFITAFLFTTLISDSVLANDIGTLQNRLNQVNSFYANFTQKIVSAITGVVQEAEGELWIKRPNLFKWHITSPEESTLVSDGKTLWFYNPLIKQVTANWLENAIDNTPLMLITRNNASDWQHYDVKQQGDSFLLIPKFYNSNLRQVTIEINSNGFIESLSSIEESGQRNIYKLKNQKNKILDDAKFHFILPRNVTLDDQRQ